MKPNYEEGFERHCAGRSQVDKAMPCDHEGCWFGSYHSRQNSYLAAL